MEKSIIIVEDDDALREGLEIILSDIGYKVAAVSDSAMLNGRLTDFNPDLFLVDYRLPGENGLNIATSVRTKKDYKKTPIIIMSASGQNLQKEAKSAGANDYIRKPFDVDILIRLIKSYLS